MSISDLDLLISELPDCFERRDMPSQFEDDFIIIGVDDPDSLTTSDVSNSDLFELEGSALFISDPSLQSPPAPLLAPWIHNLIDTGTPGAPITSWTGGLHPPPDAFAFYLPFHLYHPHYWGIYLTIEGVHWIAQDLIKRTGGSLSPRDALKAARLYLYHHEAFHHRVECLATRWEVIHRERIFLGAFEKTYRDSFGTSDCLEESLAEAKTLAECKKTFKDPVLDRALTAFVADCGPGYAEGAHIHRSKQLKDQRNIFTEQLHTATFGGRTPKRPKIWNTATHLFDPLATIKSRVNYIIPRAHPLAHRSALRFRLSPSRVERRLRQLVGLTYLRTRGSHAHYRTNNGARVTIPQHSRDLKTGTLVSIIKAAGIALSLEDFCAL